jgi:hypothetical protein
MPIATGKKHRYIEMIAFGTSPVRPSEPSTTMMIGATARIGIVCDAMIQGSRLFLSALMATMPMASRIPSTEPSTKPSSVDESVTQPWNRRLRGDVARTSMVDRHSS